MKTCPYCGIAFSLDGVDHDYQFPHFGNMARRMFAAPMSQERPKPGAKSISHRLTSHLCPQCGGKVIWLTEMSSTFSEEKDDWTQDEDGETTLLFPKRRQKVLPGSVPEPYASEFLEAFYTLEISPKASAALSRRCLQLLIRDQEQIQERTLFDEVSKLISTNKLPKHLSDELDAIRNIGNFAAHPIKDVNTNAIVPIEEAEAEWTLTVLEQLLAFYFVEIPASKARRDALNQKLKNSGQKPML